MFKWNFPHLSFSLLSIVLSQDTTEKSLSPSCLLSLIRYLYTLITLSLPGWTAPALSAVPHMTDASAPYSSLWHFTGLTPGCPCLSCTGESRTSSRTQHSRYVSPRLSRGEESPPLTDRMCTEHPETIFQVLKLISPMLSQQRHWRRDGKNNPFITG